MTMQRQGCFGPCPIYSVDIRGDGSVHYNGEKCVGKTGEVETTISKDAVREMFEYFRRADFFWLYEKYIGAVDAYATTVSLKYDGYSHAVFESAGRDAAMPAAVVQIQSAIDKIVGTDRWVRTKKDCVW